LQYIGPFGNDSHPQTLIKVLQKSSHSGSHSKELNLKAENEIYKNFDAHLRYSYKQAHKNTAIEDNTILINEKSQPMGVSLINNFIAPVINIDIHIPSGTSSGS
jgi:hypothetical protein